MAAVLTFASSAKNTGNEFTTRAAISPITTAVEAGEC